MNIFLNGQFPLDMRHFCRESGLLCSRKHYPVHGFEHDYHDSLPACLIEGRDRLIITCIVCNILHPPLSEVFLKVIRGIAHVFLKTMFASYIVQYLGQQTDSYLFCALLIC